MSEIAEVLVFENKRTNFRELLVHTISTRNWLATLAKDLEDDSRVQTTKYDIKLETGFKPYSMVTATVLVFHQSLH